MYNPILLKTDYSLLKSLIKIEDLITFLIDNKINACAITDNNLYGSINFYQNLVKNNIKPVIGLEVIIDSKPLYLYALNFKGYQELIEIDLIKQTRYIDIKDLNNNHNLICLIPYKSHELYFIFHKLFKTFLSYESIDEKKNALLITKNIVFANQILCLKKEDTNYLNYLEMINSGKSISKYEVQDYSHNYYLDSLDESDVKTTIDFLSLFNFRIPLFSPLPQYDKSIKDSNAYLSALCQKGLLKRLNNKVSTKYVERLKYELKTIKELDFSNYFLIVYDYVKYAKKNDILVGPGRGSAAGSLVSYSLGITSIDPIKYDLLFERFLNKERVSMPDIDIDFEYTKRDKVVNYLKEKYGKEFVAPIMTFGTLGSKQVIRDVGRALEVNLNEIDKLCNKIVASDSLKYNYPHVKHLLVSNELKQVYKTSLKLEGLKRHISTHAAGVVISHNPLKEIIPLVNQNNNYLTGVTMEYLEDLGLLKMDLLALKNLTIISNVLKLIKESKNVEVSLNDIPLNDLKTLSLFQTGDTVGIFQFESRGMKSFLKKLQPTSFSDLIAAIALFRPGPMQNIDSFIRRKHHEEDIDYLDDSLKNILKETYGIIVYQEQILLILQTLAGYTYSQADIIRKAMSKKNESVMKKERITFVSNCQSKGIAKEKAEHIYDLIVTFSNYGFNKAHSVSYALIGYWMAYLKINYPLYYIANLLNMAIGSEIKTKEYLVEAKKNNIIIKKPDINQSSNEYLVNDNSILLPFSIIKNIGITGSNTIIEERKKRDYKDFFDFLSRNYGKSVNKKNIEFLINAGVFDNFNYNHQTLINNIDVAINYAEIRNDLDESVVLTPNIKIESEYPDNELLLKEIEVYGFYVSNHPVIKYNNQVKLNEIKNYFDKNINMVVLVTRISSIKTKNNEDMAFLTIEDETIIQDAILFPKKYYLLKEIKEGDLIKINGQVTKRFDNYQIVINRLEKTFDSKEL